MTLSELLPTIFAAASLVVLVAGFIQSLTGFGFAIVSVPVLVLFLEPKVAIQTSLVLGFVLSAAILAPNLKREHERARLSIPLLLGGVLGIPLGSFILITISSEALRLLVGAIGIVLAILIIRGFAIKVQHEAVASTIVGIVSGALNSTTSMGGVPVALFLTNQGSDKINLRVNMLTYLLLANMVTIAVLMGSGSLSRDILLLSLMLAPALLVGLGLGAWVFPRVNAENFSRIVLGTVLITSLAGIASALYSYF